MAQSQHQYPPRSYSPPRSTPSPHPTAYLPPNKRQRLSPNPPSPYASPSMSNGSLPNQMFSSPHFGGHVNGYQQRPYLDAPQAMPVAGVMGPPSRPAPMDKPTDVNDLTDVLAGSGVDLREEEAALVNRFNTSHQQQNGIAFAQDTNLHPNVGRSLGPPMSDLSGYRQTNTLSPNVPGERNTFYGGGTLNQAPVPIQSLEDRAEAERKRAIRRKAERKQYHLNDPFLMGSSVHRRISKHIDSMQVAINKHGLLQPNNRSSQGLQLVVAGPDKNEMLVMVKGEDLLYENAPLAEFLTLISLASQERLRNVVEDTATLAKGRRTGSHGVVPTDLTDLAIGSGIPDPVSSLPTPGNSAVSPKENPLKRSFSEANSLPTPISEGAKSPGTIALPNQLAQVLRQTIQSERSMEEARAAKRSNRNANGLLSGEGSRAGSISLGTPGSGTSGILGERAPDVDGRRVSSKKEQRRQADAKATEAQQHATTNNTINMALGGKKLSWMTSKATPASNTGFPGPPRVNTNQPGQLKVTNGAAGASALGKKHIGDFREDREGGAGIQMRDVVSVLEPESKEKRALARAYTKMSSKR